ncbi:MAG: PD40 domain-containing protein [Chloroflexi bacterium]|nr:PD40 domain-containing protein [Chloroflexota bacterium]
MPASRRYSFFVATCLAALAAVAFAVLFAACQRAPGAQGKQDGVERQTSGAEREAPDATTSEPDANASRTVPGVGAPAFAGRIAFASVDGAIRSVLPDGKDPIVVASPDPGSAGGRFGGAYTWPVWSPDGSALLLSRVVEEDGRRLQASLVKASASGNETPSLIYRDDPGSFGIGTGVPHYAVWSPDSSRVALIAGGGSGLMTIFVDPSLRLAPDAFVGGEAMFLAWSADSRHLLVHHGDSLRLVEFDEQGGRSGGSQGVGGGSFDYLAPQFEPAGDRFVYVEAEGGRSLVKLGWVGEAETRALAESAGQIAFRLSPDGRMVAFLEGEDQRVFQRLVVVDTATGDRNVLLSRPMHSFWWSPDGTKIAVASLADGGLDALAWSVVDLATRQEIDLGVNVPTAEFQFMQTFFDQYAHSHAIWSPDSRAIVVFGAMPGSPGDGQDADTDAPDPGAYAWVLDATGHRPPARVGAGYIGAWSPR